MDICIYFYLQIPDKNLNLYLRNVYNELIKLTKMRTESLRYASVGRGRAGRYLSVQRRLARYLNTSPAHFFESRRRNEAQSNAQRQEMFWFAPLRLRIHRIREE
jgi:hypothetical protein